MLRFNFAETRESAYSKYLKPDLFFLLIVIASVIVGTFIYTLSVKEEIRKAQSRIEQLNREIRRLHQIQRREKELLSMKRKLQEKLAVVSKLDKNRKVPRFLYFFADPENVKGIWLNSLDYSGRKLVISGGTLDILRFPNFLSVTEEKLGRVLFRSTERQVYENKELNFKQIYYKFNFGVELRNGTAR